MSVQQWRLGKLSILNRAIALALAVIWMGAGAVGIALGLIHGQGLIVVLALFAIWYAVLWFRVGAWSRLLTWRELFAPRRDH
jgi:hypothetical protein